MSSQSASVMSKKGFASNAPRLLTRMSTFGNSFAIASTPASIDRSPAAPRSCAFGTSLAIRDTASSTRSCVRPFTITVAPSRARVLAIAAPMPSVDPLTRAVFPWSWRSISSKASFRFTRQYYDVKTTRIVFIRTVAASATHSDSRARIRIAPHRAFAERTAARQAPPRTRRRSRTSRA